MVKYHVRTFCFELAKEKFFNTCARLPQNCFFLKGRLFFKAFEYTFGGYKVLLNCIFNTTVFIESTFPI